MSLLYAPRLKLTTEAEEQQVNGYPVRRYRHILNAEGSSNSDTPLTVINDPLCPNRGDLDPIDVTAYIDRVRVMRTVDDSRPFFDIHIETRTDFEEATDPRTDPAEVEWYSQSYQGFSVTDRKGKYVFNTAGSLVKFAHDDAQWIARVTKNVTETPHGIFQYENAINDSAVRIDGRTAEKETLRCNGIRISPWVLANVSGNRVWYRKLTFLLIHKRDTWKIIKDNVGFEELKIRRRPKMIYIEREEDPHPRGGRRRQYELVHEVDADGRPIYEMRAEREPIILPGGQRPFSEQVLNRQGQWVPDPRPEDVLPIEIDHYPLLSFSQLPGVGDASRPRGITNLNNS